MRLTSVSAVDFTVFHTRTSDARVADDCNPVGYVSNREPPTHVTKRTHVQFSQKSIWNDDFELTAFGKKPYPLPHSEIYGEFIPNVAVENRFHFGVIVEAEL